MKVTEEIKLRVLEEVQSSTWGHTSIRDAIGIAKELLKEHSYVYVYRKWVNHGMEKQKRVYREGWKSIANLEEPSIYCMVGARVADEGGVLNFTTLVSRIGERKVPTAPPMEYWTLWDRFSLMFGTDLIRIFCGRVECTDTDQLKALVDFWEEVLSEVDGRPMLTVLRYYTVADYSKLCNLSRGELLQEINTLTRWLTARNDEETLGEVPLIAKGLTGSVVSMRARLAMRIKFWKEVMRTGEDVWNLAKVYSVTRPEWANGQKSVNGAFICGDA